MNTVALSFAINVDQARQAAIIDRACDALAAFGTSRISRISFDRHTLLLTSSGTDCMAHADGMAVVLPCRLVLQRSGRTIDATGLLRQLRQNGQSFADDLEPPFAAFAGGMGKLVVTADHVGLAHLFLAQEKDCAAAATSAALLAKLFCRNFTFDGMFTHMTVGHRIGAATAFEGVTLLPPAHGAALSNGRIDLHRNSEPGSVANGDWKQAGRQAICDAVRRCIDARPDCGIELSGGLDSRMVLAALPENRRKGRRAYTIGYQGSGDVRIAKDIASVTGLKHVFADLAQFAAESADDTWARAKRVAYRDDFATNVMDRLPIDCIDDLLIDNERIGGVNGEFARGFYYAGMPLFGEAGASAGRQLVSWRLITNDAAPRVLFDRSKSEQALFRLQDFVTAELAKTGKPLGSALDELYLGQRMRHWAGAAITRAMTQRMILVPFFHWDYVQWARSLDPQLKKDSRAFASVMMTLDSGLARRMLDSGMTPQDLATGGLAIQMRRLGKLASKFANKLSQRFGNNRRSSMGSQQFQAKLARPELVERLDWDGFGKLGIFDENGLKQLRQHELPWSRTTLGYLLGYHFQMEYLALPRAEPGYSVTDIDLAQAEEVR